MGDKTLGKNGKGDDGGDPKGGGVADCEEEVVAEEKRGAENCDVDDDGDAVDIGGMTSGGRRGFFLVVGGEMLTRRARLDGD